ncbi:MAG: hypothetical protein ACOC8F_07155 [Planctomycetota bacterium]
MRGFRPSRYGVYDDSDIRRQSRETRLLTYARRVRDGLPVFEETTFSQGAIRRNKARLQGT